jgi:hypothetical protein
MIILYTLTTFELQKYLTFGIGKSFTLFLSKIRLSAHSLAIETGSLRFT